MGVENFYIEKGLAELASPESICLDVKSSVIFSKGCFVVKAFAFQRLNDKLYNNRRNFCLKVNFKRFRNYVIIIITFNDNI